MKIVVLIFQFLFVLSNLVGLPGNIVSLVCPLILLIWGNLTIKYFILIIIIIGLGEIIEFLSTYLSGKYFGLDKKSIYFSIAFAIILGILMAPILFGIGAVIGTFVGAFLGTFLYEIYTTKNILTSIKRGLISLTGKVTGTFIKIALGITTVYLSYLFG